VRAGSTCGGTGPGPSPVDQTYFLALTDNWQEVPWGVPSNRGHASFFSKCQCSKPLGRPKDEDRTMKTTCTFQTAAPPIRDVSEELEMALREAERGVYTLRLFVSGMTPNSLRAIENVRRICTEYLAGRYQLEIIDIYQHPILAKERQIVAAPTLVKELPPPLRSFVGDMSHTERILLGLDVRMKR
jgi:circadian clock protein KaiB